METGINGEIIVSSVVFFWIFLVFSAIGLWSLKRKDPMHFWSGIIVNPDTITDVKKYNRANAIMWFSYASAVLLYIVCLIWGFQALAKFIFIVGVIGGLGWMILTYKIIHKKYRKK